MVNSPVLTSQQKYLIAEPSSNLITNSPTTDSKICTMLGLSNLTSAIEPVPVEPILPNFALCHPAYGDTLKGPFGLTTASILPQGTTPTLYTIYQDKQGQASKYTLPFKVSYADVRIDVQVAGPVDATSMLLIPNEIRGMAAYLASVCGGGSGTGGFITSGIHGLVDFVTNPWSDLDAPRYPNSTAFLTVTMTSPQIYTQAGDYDPEMALFLARAERNALDGIQPPLDVRILDRGRRFAVQATHMKRLGDVAWWDAVPLQSKTTEASNRTHDAMTTDVTAAEIATSRRKRDSREHPNG